MRQLLRRVWYLIRRRRFEDDLAEEMEFHRSLTTGAAFGSGALARNQARDVWIWPWLQDIAQDVRFAGRLLTKDRRFTLAAVLALSLGIAANNTIFTFINAALIRDLPFAHPERVVSLLTMDRRGEERGVSYPDFHDWRDATRAFAGIAASTGTAMNLSGDERAPERVSGALISADAFRLIGREPIVGRGFLPEDERPGAPAVIVLGHAVWTGRFGGDPAVAGRTIRVNGAPAVVVGIMPGGFRFPMIAEAWQPLSAPGTAKRDARTLNVIGRLADGVTIDQARADIGAIAGRLAREYPDTNSGVAGSVAPMMEGMRRSSKPILATMMVAVAFVLLIACANVANLLLARAAGRSREIAIRASLGATRWRIVRQLLIESLLLATLAGMVGVILSLWSIRYFGVAFDVMEIGNDTFRTPYWVNLSMNAPVFVFAAALSLGSSVVFGLMPALHVSKTNMNDALKEGGRSIGSARVRTWTSVLMIGELALTMVLLTGAGLMVRSFLTLYRTNRVIDTSPLMTARLTLPAQKYATSGQRQAFFERLDQRLASQPGLAAALASDIPFASMGPPSRELLIEGRASAAGETPPMVWSVNIGDRYFATLGLRLTRGRGLTAVDGEAGHEGAIVNQRFVAKFFPDADPIGRRIRLVSPGPSAAPAVWFTIAGIVPTLPQFGPLHQEDEPVAYLPLRADATIGRSMSLVVRDAGTATRLGATASLLRQELHALDPDLPLYAVQTMDDVVARTRYSHRIIGSLFGLLALIAVALSSVGLFALTAHGVSQRTQEIGVRMALGAQRRQVVWLFMRRTFVQLGIGLALGLAGALSVGQLLQGFLVHTGPRDPLTLVAICLLLASVALAAASLPARRAARVDPVVALRYE